MFDSSYKSVPPKRVGYIKGEFVKVDDWPDGKRVDKTIAGDTEATIARGAEYAAESTGEVEFTLRQAMRERALWIYLLFHSIRSLSLPVLGLHLIPHLTDIGLDPIAAAGAYGTSMFMQIPGRLVTGWLADRSRPEQLKYLLMAGLLVEAVAVFILLRATNMVGVWVFVVIYGLGDGAQLNLTPIIRARFWGRKGFATISGLAGTASALIGLPAPIYAGWTYDVTGSYRAAFTLLVILLLLATAATFFLRPPKPPEKVGKVTEFF